MDPVPELPYRPAACEWPLIKAGHMSAPDYAPSSPKNFLALRGASTHVQNLSHIWSGDGFGLRDLRLIERPHVHVALG